MVIRNIERVLSHRCPIPRYSSTVKRVFEQLKPVLEERTTRLLAAELAEAS
ncbi:hypothetical protein BH09MYX1_BH09MYX1_14700 [soil metagenome]